jgi:hypothetical protein
MTMLPALVAHSDWGTDPRKRWMARAFRRDHGGILARPPEPVGDPGTLLDRLRADAGPLGCALAGFDFPIGLPLGYAERAGIGDFLAALPLFGHAEWPEFYDPAQHASEIGLRRPFYPRRPGQSKRAHLVDHLGLESFDQLLRRCDCGNGSRRAAAPIFWTMGGQQAGKAAIVGWRDMLGPAIAAGANVAIWPFAGRLFELLQPGRVVVAETYPAEAYRHLGVSFPAPRAGQRSGKRIQRDRAANAPALLAWAARNDVALLPELRATIVDGFGARADGDDRFDAVIGLFMLLNVVLGNQPPGDPADEAARRIEGWVLGQAAGPET